MYACFSQQEPGKSPHSGWKCNERTLLAHATTRFKTFHSHMHEDVETTCHVMPGPGSSWPSLTLNPRPFCADIRCRYGLETVCTIQILLHSFDSSFDSPVTCNNFKHTAPPRTLPFPLHPACVPCNTSSSPLPTCRVKEGV